MEQLRDIITIFLGIFIFVYPLFFVPFLWKRTDVMIFVAVTMIFSGIFCLALLWWDDFSTWKLMEYYGWDPAGMGDIECFQDVAECDMERVKNLWNHNMGVGWPLKAFFSYIVILPTQWILSIVEYLIIRHVKR